MALPAALLVAWELSTRLGWVNTRLLVPPDAGFADGPGGAARGRAVATARRESRRDLGGAALGALFGIIVGSIMGVSRLWERVIGPTFHAAKQVAIFGLDPADERLARHR